MQPLRILILTNRVPWPLHDGGAMAMDALIEGYFQAGMSVYLLAMNTTRHQVPDELLARLYPQIAGFEAVPVNNEVTRSTILKNLFFSSKPEHVARFQHPAFAKKVQEVMDNFQPDVVQVESLFLSSYLHLIRPAKSVLRVHNVEYQIWNRLAGDAKGWKKIYLNLLAKRMRRYEAEIWAGYDLLLPITAVDAAIIHKVHPELKLQIAPFGIKVPDALPVPSTFKQAYHIGAMDWLPNVAAIDWLLQDIWPNIRSAVPDAVFTFGGRRMPARFLTQLPEGVRCAGEIADVFPFILDKQVLLVPLKAGGGIRVKILEAMACGKLVISSNTGMQGIDAVAGVHYLEANSPDDFARAFAKANSAPEAAATMIGNARKLMQDEYSDEAIVKRILDAFRQIIAKRER